MFNTQQRALISALLIIVFLVATTVTSWGQTGGAEFTYSTEEEPAAVGHNFAVQIPAGFVISGNRNNFLLEVTRDESETGDYFDILTAALRDIPANVGTTFKENGQWSQIKLQVLWEALEVGEEGVKNREYVADEEYPWAQFTSYAFHEEDDLAALNGVTRFLLHGDKIIELQCGNLFFQANQAQAEEDLRGTELCKNYFESLLIIDTPK